jgi:hypothetical protein
MVCKKFSVLKIGNLMINMKYVKFRPIIESGKRVYSYGSEKQTGYEISYLNNKCQQVKTIIDGNIHCLKTTTLHSHMNLRDDWKVIE